MSGRERRKESREEMYAPASDVYVSTIAIIANIRKTCDLRRIPILYTITKIRKTEHAVQVFHIRCIPRRKRENIHLNIEIIQ